MFKKKRTIDIIMPNYNKGQFIVEAINSVIKQTYKNWRLFIIDDNSTDESKKKLRKYEKKKKIKIFYLRKNKGPAYCRNFGLKKSKSNFVAFLDSDDYWYKNKLKLQLRFMLDKNYAFTFSDYTPILFYKNKFKKLKITKLENEFTFDKFIKNSSINTSTMMLEKKEIKNIKFKNLELMEDYIFKCDLMRKTRIKFQKFPQSTAIYRIFKKSRSSKKINNIYNLWRINKKYNNLNFLNNLISLIFISLNSIKKYGFK